MQITWRRLNEGHWETEQRDPDGAPLVRAMQQEDGWRVSISGDSELRGPFPSFTHVRHAVPALLAEPATVTMDPNAVLEMIRDAVADEDGQSILDLFPTLDAWLSSGGPLPLDWRRRGPGAWQQSRSRS